MPEFGSMASKYPTAYATGVHDSVFSALYDDL